MKTEPPGPPIALLIAVGCLSFVLLGYQIALMRLLSYAVWYHFASMIISVALLGFGGAGTLLSLFRKSATSNAQTVFFGSTLVCLIAVAITPHILSWFSIDPFLLLSDVANAFEFLLFLAYLVVGFLSGALVIGLAFLLYPGMIGRVYCANLAGSAAGSVGAVALLEAVGPEQLAPLLVLIGLPALWASGTGMRARLPAVLIIGVGTAVLVAGPRAELPMSQFKPLAMARLMPGTQVIARSTNPLGVVETVEGPSLRVASGLSLNFTGIIPAETVVFQDGERVGPLIPKTDSLGLHVLEHSTAFFPYCIVKPERVLVLGSGTGTDVLLAQQEGAKSVTAIDMNPALLRMVGSLYKQDAGSEHASGSLALVADDARSALGRDTSRYSLIILPVSEGMTASAAGTQAQFENYLFTLEAFTAILQHLQTGGVFVVQSWMDAPPRAAAKLLETVVEALRMVGVDHPADHLASIRSWNTAAIAASREPISSAQVNSIRRFASRMGFDLVWVPGLKGQETNTFHKLERPYLYELAGALFGGQGREYGRRYPFHIEPATDNRPYFSNFIEWKDLPRLLGSYRSGELPYLELGTFFLGATALQVSLLSLVFVALPLLALRRSGRSLWSAGPAVLFFGGLGLGYMIVEMVIIQRAVRFVGDPVHAVALVVGSLLLFSSIGSAISRRSMSRLRGKRWILSAVVLGVLIASTQALTPLLSLFGAMPAWLRFGVLAMAIAPLGVALGLPFPIGLSHLARETPHLVALAWGVNGYSSVVAASTAVLASMEFGFQLLQLVAVCSYAMAFLVLSLSRWFEPVKST